MKCSGWQTQYVYQVLCRYYVVIMWFSVHVTHENEARSYFLIKLSEREKEIGVSCNLQLFSFFTNTVVHMDWLEGILKSVKDSG